MSKDEEIEDEDELEAPEDDSDVALVPNDAADPHAIVSRKIPQKIRDRYEVISYRNAAVILTETRAAEFGQIVDALNDFSITTQMIRTAGGNESDMPKLLSTTLRPLR